MEFDKYVCELSYARPKVDLIEFVSCVYDQFKNVNCVTNAVEDYYIIRGKTPFLPVLTYKSPDTCDSLIRKLFYEKWFNFKLAEDLMRVEHSFIHNYLNINEALNCIKEIPEFLRYIEKCFFYRNSDDNVLYSETKEDEHILYYVCESYKVKISFKVTKIKKQSYDIFDTDKTSKFINMVNIDIRRDYGKQMTNSYRFVYGEYVDLMQDDVCLLLHVLNRILKHFYNYTFSDTIQLIAKRELCERVESYDWRVFITNGLYVRKCKNK